MSYRAGMIGQAELELVAVERRARETRPRLRLRLRPTATVQRELEEVEEQKGSCDWLWPGARSSTIGATQCPCTELRCTVWP